MSRRDHLLAGSVLSKSDSPLLCRGFAVVAVETGETRIPEILRTGSGAYVTSSSPPKQFDDAADPSIGVSDQSINRSIIGSRDIARTNAEQSAVPVKHFMNDTGYLLPATAASHFISLAGVEVEEVGTLGQLRDRIARASGTDNCVFTLRPLPDQPIEALYVSTSLFKREQGRVILTAPEPVDGGAKADKNGQRVAASPT